MYLKLLQKTLSYEYFLVIFLIFVSFLLPSLFPVYFRMDDALWLYMVSTNSLFDILLPFKGIIFGLYKPVINLIWFFNYRLWGINPYMYQLLLNLLFFGSLFFFYKFLKEVFDNNIATIFPFCFLAIFTDFLYILFWFSDYTFTTELFFMSLSLFLFFSGFKKNKFRIFLGYICMILAFFSKDPSVIIIPVVLFTYFIFHPKKIHPFKNKFHEILFLTIIALTVICYLMFFFTGKTRVDVSYNIAMFVKRGLFYTRELTKGIRGIVTLIALMYLIINKFSHKHILNFLGSIILLIGFKYLNVQHIVIILFLIILFFVRKELRFAVAWILSIFSGLLTISFLNKTYLLELMFGLNIIICFFIYSIFQDFYLLYKEKQKYSLYFKTLSIISILIVSLVAIKISHSYLQNLERLVSVRATFKEGVNYIINSIPFSSTVYILEYEDLGFKGRRDIRLRTMPMQKKIEIQKTMDRYYLQKFLKVLGRKDIKVKKISKIREKIKEPKYIFIYNDFEYNKFVTMNLRIKFKELICIKNKYNKAYIYKVLNY